MFNDETITDGSEQSSHISMGTDVEANFEGRGVWYSGKVNRINPDVSTPLHL